MKPSLVLKLFKGVGSSAERGRLESERETAVCFLDTNVSTLQLWGWIMLNRKGCAEGSFHFLTLAILPQGRLWDKSWPSSWKPGNSTCGLLLLPIIGLLPFNPVIHDGVIFSIGAVGAISLCGKMFSIGLLRARTLFTMKIHLNAIRAFQNNVFIEPYSSASRALRKGNEK